MAEKKKALGRGLGALLSDSDEYRKPERPSRPAAAHTNEVAIDQIEANPFQPRKDFGEEALEELANSIRVHGIIQPLTLRKLGPEKYQIISGERRFRASQIAGLKAVPAYLRQADDQQLLEMGLIENIQREDLNAIEIALSYHRLISEIGLKQDELGGRVGKNRATVANYLRLLKLAPEVQAAVKEGALSMGHARALLSVEDSTKQVDLFRKIIKEGLSVRKTEELIRQSTAPTPTKKAEPSPTNPQRKQLVDQFQRKLSDHFGTRVQLSDRDGQGEIRIPYHSDEDFNRILELLSLL